MVRYSLQDHAFNDNHVKIHTNRPSNKNEQAGGHRDDIVGTKINVYRTVPSNVLIKTYNPEVTGTILLVQK